METLEQIAEKVGRKTDEYLSDKIAAPEEWKRIRDIEFSRRLVAELAKQEPVAWLSRCFENGDVATDYKNSPATEFWSASFPVYAAPIPTPEDVRDAERYRWLLENGAANSKLNSKAVIERERGKTLVAFRYWCNPREASDAIDAAMTATQEGK